MSEDYTTAPQHLRYDADVEDVPEGQDVVTSQHETTIAAEQAILFPTRDTSVDDFPIEPESTVPKEQAKFTQVNRACKKCKCQKREKEKMKKRGQRLEKKLAKMEDEWILLGQVSCHFVKSKTCMSA